MIQTPRILRPAVLINRAPLINVPILLRRQQLPDLPIALLGPDTELQILARDRVPVLIHHHDGQQIAYRGEEQPVEVVLRAFADLVARDI